MSVTFYCPDAPVSQETNERTSPEVNWGSSNAYDILRMLGVNPGEDYCHGEIEAEDLGKVHRKILRIRTSPIPPSFSRPTREETGAKGARMVHLGVSNADIYRRLDELWALLVWADRRKLKVCWG